ncbi:MAG: YifB family Mg chelatase-like AAA ATPase [Clostridiales bacterium]|nr:YifB family Mg chelatase-like AAA ATPase [Clostridiales bacterium]MDY4182192.1 YifB family Mg chelatase-like AAA ATPase [Pseudoflavonifractor sp.]
MFCKVRSLGLHGVTGYEVTAECDLSNGLPAFDVVGLPDAAVKEARDRVRSAVKNCGFRFPVSRITVNLAPADRRKAGTVYDLPMLVGILAAGGQLPPPDPRAAFVGELSLAGALRPVTGMLPMALAARRAGISALYVPADSAAEATLAGGLTVYPVESVGQLVAHLTGEAPISPAAAWVPPAHAAGGPDFADVKGQDQVKRALEIAAAGGHNIAMIGPPGSGKSMLARRLPSILPDLSEREALEATEIHSVMGLTSREEPMVVRRPFRAPHHSISSTGMAGGGSPVPRPGEISLAHNGVLFLDELPEFHKDVLECLRQPLEEGKVQISRAAASEVFPSRFMLVCAMNPCKCGWYGHPGGRCRCSEGEVKKYLGKLSGPLLDRIDLYVEVPALEFDELSRKPKAESSAQIKERVDAARAVQAGRFGAAGPDCNAHMGPRELQEFCPLDSACQAVMKGAFDRMGLTARSYDRILRVARTIADLEGSADIQVPHLAEAIQYRESAYFRR